MPEPVEDEAAEELASIHAIFPELISTSSRTASLDLDVIPTNPIEITFKSNFNLNSVKCLTISPENRSATAGACQESRDTNDEQSQRTHAFSHLPRLHVDIELPPLYPESCPPLFHLSTEKNWLPLSKLKELEEHAEILWEGYGRSQVVFGYIDFIQCQIENGFDLGDSALLLSPTLELPLLQSEKSAKKSKFDAQTFDCGICLYPKKGSICCQIRGCGHIFCVECLQDFYNSAITEGSVEAVTCLDLTCGKDGKKKRAKSLHPTELLEIPISRDQVQRYMDLKLKKMLDSDKTTIYCPREWCQGPARSAKYRKYDTNDLENWPVDPDSDDGEPATRVYEADGRERPANTNLSTKSSNKAPTDRLAICSQCTYAFCHVCGKSWHGDFVSCLPKTAETISEEEKASFDFIRLHTSPCPHCSAPAQKTMGCNHMRCSQCGSHFCYLCSAWLSPDNPYAHFNTKGTPCYQKLWELEEGDNGGENRNRVMFAGVRGAEQQAHEFAQQFGQPNGRGEDEDVEEIRGINQDNLERFPYMLMLDEEGR